MATIFDSDIIEAHEIEREIDLLEIELEDILKDYDDPEEALYKCGSERESLKYLVDLRAFQELILNYTNGAPHAKLINEDHFYEYCQDDLKPNAGRDVLDWRESPFCFIDWVAVAENEKQYYYKIEFNDHEWFYGKY